MHYVTSFEGTLDPAPTALPGDSISLGGWLITVTGGGFKAMPPSESRWSLEEAQGELDRAMEPVLSALGAASGMKITKRVTSAHYADAADPNAIVLSTGFAYATAGGVVAIASGVEEAARLVRRCEWASKDPLYRDLLDLLTEATGSPNPRPAAFKLTERLEKKFGGIPNTKARLGLTDAPLDAIRAHQNRFEGDRHAKYEIGHRPPPIGPAEREEVLAAARLIVEKYEETILKK